MKNIVFLLLLLSSFFSEAKNCFSGLCANSTKENLETLGFKERLLPFTFSKLRKIEGLVIRESASLRSQVLCSYTKIVPKSKIGLKLLLDELKANEVKIDQIGEKVKEKNFDEGVRYGSNRRAYRGLRFFSFRDSYRLKVYFRSSCLPENTIYTNRGK